MKNWSRFWKASTIAVTTLATFSQGMGPLALAPMFPEMMKTFDRSLADVVQFTGVCILVLGFSNFLWSVYHEKRKGRGLANDRSIGRIPISTSFGRRPVLIFSTLICLVSNVWRAVAPSYGSYMGACVLNGIGAGPAEVSL